MHDFGACCRGLSLQDEVEIMKLCVHVPCVLCRNSSDSAVSTVLCRHMCPA